MHIFRRWKHLDLDKTIGVPRMIFLLDLLSELFLVLVTFLERERDVNSICQTNKRLYALLNPYLYRRNSRTSSSVLVWVSQLGREATARNSIQEGAKVGVTDLRGRTQLCWAAENGHMAMIQVLLGTGQVDVSSTSSEGRTPLSWPVEGGNKAVVQLLEQSGGHHLQDSGDTES
jgi:ankyrin repeat protein